MAVSSLFKQVAIASVALAASDSHARTDVAKTSDAHEEHVAPAAKQEHDYQKYIDKYAGKYASEYKKYEQDGMKYAGRYAKNFAKYMNGSADEGTQNANASASPVDFVGEAMIGENLTVKDALTRIREHAETLEKQAEEKAREADEMARRKVREVDEFGRKVVQKFEDQFRKAEEKEDLSREADEAARAKIRSAEEEARQNFSEAEKQARQVAAEAERKASVQIQRAEEKAFMEARNILEKTKDSQPSVALNVNSTSLASSKKAPLVSVAEFTMTPPIDPRPVAAISLAISGMLVAMVGAAGMAFAYSRRINGLEGMAESLISPTSDRISIV